MRFHVATTGRGSRGDSHRGTRTALLAAVLSFKLDWFPGGRSAGFEHLETYQVDQTTQNYALTPGARSVAVDDYNIADVAAIMQELLPDDAVEHLVGWFERFSDLREVRRSLEERDRAPPGLGLPGLMVAIDLALGEVQHLRHYKEVCIPRYYSEMVDEALAVLGVDL